MKKLFLITFGIAGLALLFVFLPWIGNSKGYTYGYTLSPGKLGFVAISISIILLILKRYKSTIALMTINIISGFSFLIGWTSRASDYGANNVFDGLQISYFLYLLTILTFYAFIWLIMLKNKTK